MDRVGVVFIVLVLVSVHGWPLSNDKDSKVNQINAEEEDLEGCPAYSYCQGRSFPHRVKVNDYAISCEVNGVNEKFVRNHCCLPNGPHLVCYNIKVEGMNLNYSNETDNFLAATDFTDLCQHMIHAEGQNPGSNNGAILQPGGGALAFLYGEWKDVYASEASIRHLACGLED